jgi:hypothetical protein
VRLHGRVADSPVPVEGVLRGWQVATVSRLIEETARAKTIVLRARWH